MEDTILPQYKPFPISKLSNGKILCIDIIYEDYELIKKYCMCIRDDFKNIFKNNLTEENIVREFQGTFFNDSLYNLVPLTLCDSVVIINRFISQTTIKATKALKEWLETKEKKTEESNSKESESEESELIQTQIYNIIARCCCKREKRQSVSLTPNNNCKNSCDINPLDPSEEALLQKHWDLNFDLLE